MDGRTNLIFLLIDFKPTAGHGHGRYFESVFFFFALVDCEEKLAVSPFSAHCFILELRFNFEKKLKLKTSTLSRNITKVVIPVERFFVIR